MRIAYVLTSLGIGGAERQVVALAERMKARGHTVLLLVLRERQPEEWPARIDLARLEMRKTPASLAVGLAKGAHILRGFDPDLIHSHTYPANMAARLLKILIPQAAVISTIHNVYEGSWPRMLAYRLTGFLSFHTTAVSQAAAERFVRLKAVPAGKTSVITNGIDTVEFTPSLIAVLICEVKWASPGSLSGSRQDASLRPRIIRICCKPLRKRVHLFRRRSFGSRAAAETKRPRGFKRRRRSWEFTCAGWGCGAICQHCWMPPTDLRWLQHGRECRWR